MESERSHVLLDAAKWLGGTGAAAVGVPGGQVPAAILFGVAIACVAGDAYLESNRGKALMRSRQ